MVDTAVAAASYARGIVPQRLRAPHRRPDQIERSDLVERMIGCRAPIVVVRAGAGYGKSTLLSQVVAADPRPAGWLTVDPADDDPVVLLRHLVGALGDVAGDDQPVVRRGRVQRLGDRFVSGMPDVQVTDCPKGRLGRHKNSGYLGGSKPVVVPTVPRSGRN